MVSGVLNNKKDCEVKLLFLLMLICWHRSDLNQQRTGFSKVRQDQQGLHEHSWAQVHLHSDLLNFEDRLVWPKEVEVTFERLKQSQTGF